MKRNANKVISLLLSVVMVLGIIPLTASAEESLKPITKILINIHQPVAGHPVDSYCLVDVFPKEAQKTDRIDCVWRSWGESFDSSKTFEADRSYTFYLKGSNYLDCIAEGFAVTDKTEIYLVNSDGIQWDIYESFYVYKESEQTYTVTVINGFASQYEVSPGYDVFINADTANNVSGVNDT